MTHRNVIVSTIESILWDDSCGMHTASAIILMFELCHANVYLTDIGRIHISFFFFAIHFIALD